MAEDNPFAEFETGSLNEAPKAAPKSKRSRKKKAAPAPRAVTDADIKKAVEKKARKPRTANIRPVTIPIGLLPALGGLSKEETSLLMSLTGNLHNVSKKARARIVMVLGKIFL